MFGLQCCKMMDPVFVYFATFGLLSLTQREHFPPYAYFWKKNTALGKTIIRDGHKKIKFWLNR